MACALLRAMETAGFDGPTSGKGRAGALGDPPFPWPLQLYITCDGLPSLDDRTEWPDDTAVEFVQDLCETRVHR